MNSFIRQRGLKLMYLLLMSCTTSFCRPLLRRQQNVINSKTQDPVAYQSLIYQNVLGTSHMIDFCISAPLGFGMVKVRD